MKDDREGWHFVVEVSPMNDVPTSGPQVGSWSLAKIRPIPIGRLRISTRILDDYDVLGSSQRQCDDEYGQLLMKTKYYNGTLDRHLPWDHNTPECERRPSGNRELGTRTYHHETPFPLFCLFGDVAVVVASSSREHPWRLASNNPSRPMFLLGCKGQAPPQPDFTDDD